MHPSDATSAGAGTIQPRQPTPRLGVGGAGRAFSRYAVLGNQVVETLMIDA